MSVVMLYTWNQICMDWMRDSFLTDAKLKQSQFNWIEWPRPFPIRFEHISLLFSLSLFLFSGFNHF